MSKHAGEAFTDSLAQELRPLGVSVVEPGAFRTRIARNANERLRDALIEVLDLEVLDQSLSRSLPAPRAP